MNNILTFSDTALEGLKNRLHPGQYDLFESSHFQVDVTNIALIDQLAKGSYGTVYKCSFKGNTYAVKIEDFMTGIEEQVNLLVELSILQSLQHDRLVSYFGAGYLSKSSATAYKVMILMELCTCGALREGLRYPLPWSLRVRLALDIAIGLAFLHENNIIHRDIKTTNVLIDDKWRAKLCDFSFACHTDCVAKRDFIYGTDEFMAPEIAMGEDFDISADIFSFGIVLCEIMTGIEPSTHFLHREAKNLFELNIEELKAVIPTDSPESLEALVLQCCTISPSERPSAEECVDWLQAVMEEQGEGEDIDYAAVALSAMTSVDEREGHVKYPKTNNLSNMKNAKSIREGSDSLSRLAFLEVQVQELRAENRRLNREVNQLTLPDRRRSSDAGFKRMSVCDDLPTPSAFSDLSPGVHTSYDMKDRLLLLESRVNLICSQSIHRSNSRSSDTSLPYIFRSHSEEGRNREDSSGKLEEPEHINIDESIAMKFQYMQSQIDQLSSRLDGRSDPRKAQHKPDTSHPRLTVETPTSSLTPRTSTMPIEKFDLTPYALSPIPPVSPHTPVVSSLPPPTVSSSPSPPPPPPSSSSSPSGTLSAMSKLEAQMRCHVERFASLISQSKSLSMSPSASHENKIVSSIVLSNDSHDLPTNGGSTFNYINHNKQDNKKEKVETAPTLSKICPNSSVAQELSESLESFLSAANTYKEITKIEEKEKNEENDTISPLTIIAHPTRVSRSLSRSSTGSMSIDGVNTTWHDVDSNGSPDTEDDAGLTGYSLECTPTASERRASYLSDSQLLQSFEDQLSEGNENHSQCTPDRVKEIEEMAEALKTPVRPSFVTVRHSKRGSEIYAESPLISMEGRPLVSCDATSVDND